MKFFLLICSIILWAPVSFSISIEKVFGDKITISNDGKTFLKDQTYYFKGNGQLISAIGILTSGPKSMLQVIKGVEHLSVGTNLKVLKLKAGTKVKSTKKIIKTTYSNTSNNKEVQKTNQSAVSVGSSIENNTSLLPSENTFETSQDSINDIETLEDEKEYKTSKPDYKNRFFLGASYISIGKAKDHDTNGDRWEVESGSNIGLNLGYRRYISSSFFLGMNYRQGLGGSSEGVQNVSGTKTVFDLDTALADAGLHVGYQKKGWFGSIGFSYAAYGYKDSSNKFNQEINLRGTGFRVSAGHEYFFNEKFGVLFEVVYQPLSFSKGERKLSNGQILSFDLINSVKVNAIGVDVDFVLRF